MSIRFTCPTCHAVLKIAEMISEPRKVRCTGCSLVILVSPDEDAPNGVRTSVPEKPSKTGESEADIARRRNILVGAMVAVLILLLAGIWWTQRGPADRAAVEGRIMLDDVLMDKGTIVFVPIDGTPGQSVTVGVVNGRYQVSASHGPHIGVYRVEIHSERAGGGELVAKRFNAESTEKITISAGLNSKDYDVRSK